jgi:hypothetical protein
MLAAEKRERCKFGEEVSEMHTNRGPTTALLTRFTIRLAALIRLSQTAEKAKHGPSCDKA